MSEKKVSKVTLRDGTTQDVTWYQFKIPLRGDSASRANWYRDMRLAGAFSVNDILDLEDMPHVEGGDERLAPLDQVPLSRWKELSIKRNGGNDL